MSVFSSRQLGVHPGTSTLASHWKPHHAISSPHRFLWQQKSNHSETTHQSLSLLNHLSPFSCSYNLILVLFFRFNRTQPPPFSESGRTNLIELSVGPNCSHQIGDGVWTQSMIYWTLLTARQFFFHTGGPQTSFPLTSIQEQCGACMLAYIDLIYVHLLLIWMVTLI